MLISDLKNTLLFADPIPEKHFLLKAKCSYLQKNKWTQGEP
jgi:hypothetical protein